MTDQAARARTIKMSRLAAKDLIPIAISSLSLVVAIVAVVLSTSKDISVNLKTSTRDWQKGTIFSILLQSDAPLTIDEIESRYITAAAAFKDKFKLTDEKFSKDEIYSVLIDLMSSQSIKMRDARYFSPKEDDDVIQERRVVFEMLRFALENEYKYQYDEFASQFANSQSEKQKMQFSKANALSVLSLAIQSNIIGLVIKPGTKLVIGEAAPLYVASVFSIRTNAPALLPYPQIPSITTK